MAVGMAQPRQNQSLHCKEIHQMINSTTLAFPPLPRLASTTRPGDRPRLKFTTSTTAGAGIGLGLFLAVALLPAVLYGAVAGVQLANGVFGAPNASGFAVNTFILVGIVSAVTALASLFAALGAVLGASVDALIELTEVGRAG
jgi:hypothetical protein